MRSRMVAIPVTEVGPGENFAFLGTQYVRATEDQVPKHPARELAEGKSAVLAYMLGYRHGKSVRTPMSIVSDATVWITREVGNGR